MCLPPVPSTLLAVIFCSLLCNVADCLNSPLWNETWTDKLKRDLFLRYDKFSRPTEHYNTTTVNFDFYLLHFSVDEEDFSITAYGYAKHKWVDEKLKWNSSMYGGLGQINIAASKIWQPDISVYNSADGTATHYSESLSIVYSDGSVLWVPAAKFKVLCDFDYRLWPFDTQNCTAHIGSWTYDGTKIDIVANINNSLEVDLLVLNMHWKLLNVSLAREEIVYSCCAEPYPKVIITLTIQRNSGFYRSILLTPIIAIVTLILITFWLPCQSETRVILASCTTLLIVIYLIYLSFKIPETSNPPLILYFYSGCLCQVTISLILSVLMINMSKKTFYKPLPRTIKIILLSRPGRLLGLKDLVKMIQSQKPATSQELHGKLMDEAGVVSATNSLHDSNDDCDRQNMISPREDTSRLEWIMAATAIDRLAFFIFSFTFAVMAIAYLT